MDEKKISFIFRRNLKFKKSLSYSSTLNDSTEIFKNYPNYNLLSEYSEIKDIMKENNLELMKYFYFNRKQINVITYNEEEVIEINSKIVQNKYSEYFYLALLIEDNPDVVNYKYTLEFIQEINDQIKKIKNSFLREMMMSKIILVLIKNFRETDEYNENYKNEIEDLLKLNKKRIESNANIIKDLNLNYEKIENKKIEEIYMEIIMDLINNPNKIKNADNIMIQLDLENIDITKAMYDGLVSILKSNNNKMEKFNLSEKKDLNSVDSDDIINFYNILFKYILKKPIYIYQIQFLNEMRKKIFEIVKNNIGKKNHEKLEYIINFFTDKYYSFLLKRLHTKKDKSTSRYDDTSTEVKSEIPSRVQTTISSHENDNDNYSLIRFEENFPSSKSENYTRLIREMSNGNIIRLHNLNDITIYEKDIKNKKVTIKFNSIKPEEVPTNNNSKNNINFEELTKKAFESNKIISNIIETNESIEKKDKNFNQMMICSKEGLIIYKISDNQKSIVKTLRPSCTGCFEIKDKSFVIIGEKGISHYKDLNNLKKFEIDKDKPKNKNENDVKTENLPFRGCIKINDNYIALTSNSILPNGKNLLCIYDVKSNRLFEGPEFSFVVGVNGLSLMDIVEEGDEKDKNDNKNQKEIKILLCACKKYIHSQKNGIMIIDTNSIGEEKILNKNKDFYETDDFEVCCFCPLKIKKDKKMQKTNYFLAGGLDGEKRQGMIKLYRVQYNEKKDKIMIEFLQDIEIETNDKFTGFNSNIECMMQHQSDGKIYVSSSDGNLNLFSDPNLDYYLEEKQMFEELKSLFSQ